jgi:uncharacterized protein YjiS (DUF1127 family)
MPLQTTLGPAQAATRRPRRKYNSPASHGLTATLAGRAHSRRQLCKLDDHILRDIGLTRDALLREATRQFERQRPYLAL